LLVNIHQGARDTAFDPDTDYGYRIVTVYPEGTSDGLERRSRAAARSATMTAMDIDVVVAIDFGTAQSGYAFAYPRVASPVPRVRTDWPGQPTPYVKTLTQLLVDRAGEAVAWGYEAPMKLALLRQTKEGEGYRLLRNFKLEIPKLRQGASDGKVEADGVRFQLIDLVASYLRELARMALDELDQAGTKTLRRSAVRWVITVPAIWEDWDKRFMRDAARRAGLIGEGEDEDRRLVLALEPEAAALYCVYKDREQNKSELVPGRRYMVADAGGGTVDLTSYEVTAEGLCELAPGSGDVCGSTTIDEKYLSHVACLMGVAEYERFRADQPTTFLQLQEGWERAKVNFRGDDKNAVLISIPPGLYRALAPEVRERLRQTQSGDDENFHLSPTTMRALFQSSLDTTERLVADHLGRIDDRRCDYLFLVGGFARSPVLQQRIRQRFGGQFDKIVIPLEPGEAVVAGAVLFGLNPRTSIIQRRMRYAYGIQARVDYEEGVHDPGRAEWDEEDQRKVVKKHFEKLVSPGEVVRVDQTVALRVTASLPHSPRVTVRLFKTLRGDVRYTDEAGVIAVDPISISVSPLDKSATRPMIVSLYFGQTELRAEVRDLHSGTNESSTLEYD
jgi:hypothetical protein